MGRGQSGHRKKEPTMLIVRNKIELARHVARYIDVNGERHPSIARDAIRGAEAALARWNEGTPSQHKAFNDFWGPPPTVR